MMRWLRLIFLLLAASAFAHAPEPKFVLPSGLLHSYVAAGTANALAQNVSVNNIGADLYTDKTFATTNGLTLTNGDNQLRFKATDASQSLTITQIFNLPATVTYAYDQNGNLISDGARGYDYDDADRLIRITATNQWKSEFVYDAFGRRVVRKEFIWQSSTWTQVEEVRYVWLGMSVLQERDAANNVKVTYTGRLAREDATSTSFYFTDGNGNVSSLIDASGNIKARYRYDSFGNMISKSGPLADVNLIRFSGKEHHANSGLYYYGFRFYAPNLQRWMNEDPIGIAGGLNLYGFVGNDPINFQDPYGLWPGCNPSQEWWDKINAEHGRPNANSDKDFEADLLGEDSPLTYGALHDLSDEDDGIARFSGFKGNVSDSAYFLLGLTPQSTFSVVALGESLGGQKAGGGQRVTAAAMSGPGIGIAMTVGGKVVYRVTGALLKKLKGKSPQEIEKILAKECPPLKGRLAGSFTGMTERNVLKNIPDGWKKVPAEGNGWVLLDKNGFERIRFMRASDETVVQWERMKQGYWIRQNERGQYLDEFGKVVADSDPDKAFKIHIPYSGAD